MVAYEKGWLPEGRRADAHHRDQRVSFPLDVIRLSLSSFLFPFTHFLPLFLSLSSLSSSHSLSLALSLFPTPPLVSLPYHAVARVSLFTLSPPRGLTRFARDFM